MATRSEVYIQEADGSLHGCYIHHDGYPAERGLEYLAHEEAGMLRDFIAENCENDVEEDGFDFVCANEDSPAKLNEWRSPDTSFEQATTAFNQLLESCQAEGWRIIGKNDEEFIAKNGNVVAIVKKI